MQVASASIVRGDSDRIRGLGNYGGAEDVRGTGGAGKSIVGQTATGVCILINHQFQCHPSVAHAVATGRQIGARSTTRNH